MPPKASPVPEESNVARFGRVKNNLKMGLVGLPNVGKSSLFNLLTEQSAAAENYPFCTIDPNEARCAVPDVRYDHLCSLWNPPSMYPAFLQCTDIAGLIRGASEGAGLGNAFLSHIQAVDGLFHVVRAFASEEVVHVDDSVDPLRDLETIQMELCKKDLQYVAAQRAVREHDVKRNPNMKLPPLFFSVLDKVQEVLENNKPIFAHEWSAVEIEKINELVPGCITTKPVMYVINLSKKDYLRKGNKWLVPIKNWIDAHGGGVMIPFSIEFEEEVWNTKKASGTSEVSGAEKAAASEAAATAAGGKSVLSRMIKVGYKQLNMMYYFTAGEKEVRCWTVRKGATAPMAAGVIHSDFERGFIKAEVVSFSDFKEYAGDDKKGMVHVKAAGKCRQEGKTYVVQDGDIIHFQFNVNKKK